MLFTSPLFDAKVLARGRTVYPRKMFFSEILPLCSKNKVSARRMRVAGSSCTQELQALFGCLKKWEFDDKPCAKQHQAYMICVNEAEKLVEEYKRAAEKGTLGERSHSGSMPSSAQLNKIMQLFPQPDLGRPPYRQMKRLPSQSYADDIFHRKHIKGKRS
uniref:CHCH domain-containing protein n=1 Tax=Ascaris lumbricoides TaxID=6252 RepID=A0A9J2Q844_ASCLU